ESKGRPGARAPHVWLTRDGEQISSLDLFGRNFVLLAGPDGSTWCEIARAAARQLDLVLDIYRIGLDGISDSNGEFHAGFGLTPTGAALIRPDGFVAWRATTAAGASTDVIGNVLRTISAARASAYRSASPGRQ